MSGARSHSGEREWCEQCAEIVAKLEKTGALKIADLSSCGVPAFVCMWTIRPSNGLLDVSELIRLFRKSENAESRHRLFAPFSSSGVSLTVAHDRTPEVDDLDARQNTAESRGRSLDDDDEDDGGVVDLSAITRKITENGVDYRHLCGDLGELFAVDPQIENRDDRREKRSRRDATINLTEWVAEIERKSAPTKIKVVVYWRIKEPQNYESDTLKVAVAPIADSVTAREAAAAAAVAAVAAVAGERATTKGEAKAKAKTTDRVKRRRIKTALATTGDRDFSSDSKTANDKPRAVQSRWKRATSLFAAIALGTACATVAVAAASRAYDAYSQLAASFR